MNILNNREHQVGDVTYVLLRVTLRNSMVKLAQKRRNQPSSSVRIVIYSYASTMNLNSPLDYTTGEKTKA